MRQCPLTVLDGGEAPVDVVGEDGPVPGSLHRHVVPLPVIERALRLSGELPVPRTLQCAQPQVWFMLRMCCLRGTKPAQLPELVTGSHAFTMSDAISRK